jgi:hypothetical protein
MAAYWKMGEITPCGQSWCLYSGINQMLLARVIPEKSGYCLEVFGKRVPAWRQMKVVESLFPDLISARVVAVNAAKQALQEYTKALYDDLDSIRYADNRP